MTLRTRLFASAAALSLAACGTTTSYVTTNASPRALTPRAVTEVQVLTAQAPTQPFVEVAVLQSRDTGAYGAAPTPKLIHDMRVEAAGLGCDALLVYGAHNPPAQPSSRAFDGLWGACLVFGTAPAPVATAPVEAAPAPVATAPAPVAIAPAPVATAPVVAPQAPVAPAAAPAPVAVPRGAYVPETAAPVAGGGVFARMFDRLDKNHDGILAADEIPENVREKLMKLDTSGEGWLTRDEMVRADQDPPRQPGIRGWSRRKR